MRLDPGETGATDDAGEDVIDLAVEMLRCQQTDVLMALKREVRPEPVPVSALLGVAVALAAVAVLNGLLYLLAR